MHIHEQLHANTNQKVIQAAVVKDTNIKVSSKAKGYLAYRLIHNRSTHICI